MAAALDELLTLAMIEIAYRRMQWRRVLDTETLLGQARDVLASYRSTHGAKAPIDATLLLATIDDYLTDLFRREPQRAQR